MSLSGILLQLSSTAILVGCGAVGDDVHGAVQGPFWLWIATLAGAIYAGYPSHWCATPFLHLHPPAVG